MIVLLVIVLVWMVSRAGKDRRLRCRVHLLGIHVEVDSEPPADPPVAGEPPG